MLLGATPSPVGDLAGIARCQVPEATAPAEGLAAMLAWLAALPAPLLPASAARGAERCLPLVFEAEAWLSEALPPAEWAVFRLVISTSALLPIIILLLPDRLVLAQLLQLPSASLHHGCATLKVTAWLEGTM